MLILALVQQFADYVVAKNQLKKLHTPSGLNFPNAFIATFIYRFNVLIIPK